MPITPTYPGVYVEEIPSGVRTIVAVSTSVTAFMGGARRGPIDKPVRILSFSDFERHFGGLDTESEMSFAVRQFFVNGGSDAWAVRVAGDPKAEAERTLQNSSNKKVLVITARDEGKAGNQISLMVEHDKARGTFDLTVEYMPPDSPAQAVREIFKNLSMHRKEARFVETVVQDGSRLVTARRHEDAVAAGPGTSTSGELEKVQDLLSDTQNQFQVSVNGLPPVTVTLKDGTDNAGADDDARLTKLCAAIQAKVRAAAAERAPLKNFTCVRVGKTIKMTSGEAGEDSKVRVLPGATKDVSAALELGPGNGGEELDAVGAIRPKEESIGLFLEKGDEKAVTQENAYAAYVGKEEDESGLYALARIDLFNLLCLPGTTDPGILAEAAAYCQQRRAFLIVDAPGQGLSVKDMSELAPTSKLPKNDHAAVFYPWVEVANPLDSGRLRTCAPSGSIAGLFARTDATRGVWKAPAGIEATLTGVQRVVPTLTDGENGVLNPLGVNCIRMLPVYGPVNWGARTLRGADQMTSEWKYIPVRRTALLIEESLYRGTQWVVFEPNDEPLWAQIRLNVGAFMHTLFRQGAFAGKTPREAYFVKCDAETTTRDDQNRGVVNILAGFAPLIPAEFVFVKIQQMAGQTQV